MRTDTVLVTGAAGAIGRRMVPHLLARGRRVRAMVRDVARAPFAGQPNLEIAMADLRDLDSLRTVTQGAGAVVHLAGAKQDEPDSEETNVRGAENLAYACKENGVRLIVNISTQSAGLRRPGAYGRTKARAETVLQRSSVPVITFRVSVVYSDLSGGVFGKLVSTSRLPVTPVLSPGTAIYWPIHLDDLAEAVSRALDRPELAGHTFDLGGPDRVTLNELIDRLAARQGRRARKLHAPASVGLLAARLAARLPRPPITVSNVLGSIEQVPMDVEPTFHALGFRPRSLDDGLVELFEAERSSDREAALLLSYAGSWRGRPWVAAERDIRLYREALAAHRINPGHALDESIFRHPALLGGLDLASRLLHPAGVLQKKLLVAAALVESDPRSADRLLPRKRSRVAVALRLGALAPRLAAKTVAAAALLARPGFLRRNAGA